MNITIKREGGGGDGMGWDGMGWDGMKNSHKCSEMTKGNQVAIIIISGMRNDGWVQDTVGNVVKGR